MNLASDAFAKKVFRKYKSVNSKTSRSFLKFLTENLPDENLRNSGKGIVVCGGGQRLIPSMFVCVSMLRHFGITLPIQIWHLGEREVVGNIKDVFSHLDVKWHDAEKLAALHPQRRPLGGYELKAFSLFHCGFEDALYLDADCIQVESGEIFVNVNSCSRLLRLQLLINQYADFYFQYFFGDKHTLQMAVALLHQKVTLMDNCRFLPHEGLSHGWLDGDPLFDHMCNSKYIHRSFPIKSSFHNLDLHRKFLSDLAARWVFPLPWPLEMIRRPAEA